MDTKIFKKIKMDTSNINLAQVQTLQLQTFHLEKVHQTAGGHRESHSPLDSGVAEPFNRASLALLAR